MTYHSDILSFSNMRSQLCSIGTATLKKQPLLWIICNLPLLQMPSHSFGRQGIQTCPHGASFSVGGSRSLINTDLAPITAETIEVSLHVIWAQDYLRMDTPIPICCQRSITDEVTESLRPNGPVEL